MRAFEERTIDKKAKFAGNDVFFLVPIFQSVQVQGGVLTPKLGRGVLQNCDFLGFDVFGNSRLDFNSSSISRPF